MKVFDSFTESEGEGRTLGHKSVNNNLKDYLLLLALGST